VTLHGTHARPCTASAPSSRDNLRPDVRSTGKARLHWHRMAVATRPTRLCGRAHRHATERTCNGTYTQRPPSHSTSVSFLALITLCIQVQLHRTMLAEPRSKRHQGALGTRFKMAAAEGWGVEQGTMFGRPQGCISWKADAHSCLRASLTGHELNDRPICASASTPRHTLWLCRHAFVQSSQSSHARLACWMLARAAAMVTAVAALRAGQRRPLTLHRNP
jgi:hypothetical protein